MKSQQVSIETYPKNSVDFIMQILTCIEKTILHETNRKGKSEKWLYYLLLW